jgi:mono/diheme cytochrome c family protein
MIRIGVLGSCFVLLAALVHPADAQPANADVIKRGEYLARAGDCFSCHTQPNGALMAGGLKVDTPYGGIYSPNITPDPETGIGKWTDDQFYKVMHDGITPDGTYLYPVMPFDHYTNVTRDDDMAIKAYLFSLPPVHAATKPDTLHFPYNIRTSLLAWRTLFFKPDTFKPDPAQSAQVNRGAYLVEGLGHCGACHTPRNALSASIASDQLGGGEITGQGWFAPNISSDVREGVGGWSEQDLVDYLKTGVAKGHAIVTGPMSEVVHTSMAYMTNDDLHAIAAYLKATPAKALYNDSKQQTKTETGEVAYMTQCSFCHQANGRGINGVIPSLAGNGAVTAGGPQDVIRTVLNGMPAAGPYAPMPGLLRALPPGEIADIVNYVRTSWGNNAPADATPDMAGTLMQSTSTMLSGTAPCAPVHPASVASALQSTEAKRALHQVNAGNTLETVRGILPKLKAAAPDASQADIINGLTAAYCPVVMADTSMKPEQRLQQLQRFSMLVFTGLSGQPLK